MNPARAALALALAAAAALPRAVFCAEALPPAPAAFCNDSAGVMSPAARGEVNRRLEQFERGTSCQILVAIFEKLPAGAAIEEYTVRVAQAWRIGQAKTDNGAVLFVFVGDRKMYLQVGYGLEGAIPDALAKRIIEDRIAPALKRGDFDGGIRAGVDAILAAARGEYRGTGSTAAEDAPPVAELAVMLMLLVFLFAVVLLAHHAGVEGRVYGRRQGRYGVFTTSGWGGSATSWGGPSSGGGWSGGGGGGFRGGGGSFGGGGAGGGW